MFLTHNSPEQAALLAAALVGACRLPEGWVTSSQPQTLGVLFDKLLNYKADFNTLPAATQNEVANALTDHQQRHELVELMVMMEMMCRPIPPALQKSVDDWARSLDVEDRVLLLARDLTEQAQIRATVDFYRLNWIGEGDALDDPHFQHLLQQYGDAAYALTVEEDPSETARWAKLKDYPTGTLGRELSCFYEKRGFKLPGQLGGANAALAQHDWLHVIGEYDTTAIGELEVTAFMASASKSPGATLGFIGAVSLYETGLLHSLVTHSYNQTLSAPGGAERVAAAIRKGKNCRVDPLTDIDFFSIANQSLEKIRSDWGICAFDAQ